MSTEYIHKAAKKLLQKYKTNDPFKIAEQLGIIIMFRHDFVDLKGMYKVILKNRFIFINSNLSPEMQKIVCAHELGHDRLHRNLAKSVALQEFMLYDMKSRPEYEANIFASEILLDTCQVLQYIDEGYDAAQIAALMNTDINLVLIKINELNKMGYKYKKCMTYNSAFLGK